jgi:type II secretory pathway pseudopilin PulG
MTANNKNNIPPKAYTLAEIFIVLAIMALIAAIVTPTLQVADIDAKLYVRSFEVIKKVNGEVIASNTMGSLLPDSTYCNSFLHIVNTVPTPAPDCTYSDYLNDDPNFTMTNGIKLFGLETSFSASNPVVVRVDVNGNRGPDTVDKDILKFNVFQNGFVEPSGTIEENIIKCKITINGYDLATKSDLISAIESITGWNHGQATSYVNTTTFPVTFLDGVPWV